MMRQRNLRVAVGVAAMAALAAAALLTAGPRDAVNWAQVRAVALESDDWGLAGFVPSDAAWEGLRREDLTPGAFPAVYWRSTLEDSAMVADLAAVLRARRGRDDRPAILQPNYVLSSLAWEDGQWRRYDLPELPRAYPRPGLWRAVASARATGVWQPEYHAVWHYDPELRQEATAASAVALEAASRGIMLFPGSEAARELGPWRSDAALAAELDAGLRIFSDLFGSRPRSLIAPDYTWNGRVERLWSSRGLRVIQAKREQRHPDLPSGVAGRLLKVVDRQWSRAAHPDRTYLERNCRLEPVQDTDPMAVARRCVEETARAWQRGEPAVVETHRVNFAHVDTAVVGTGLRALAAYLDGVGALPGPGAVFLTDAEIAALARNGTSLAERGAERIARNGTRSRRLVDAGPGGGAAQGSRMLILLDSGYHGALPHAEPGRAGAD
ncbi:MAG: hypothetical protein IPH48_04940 [bacterium]|nr:hypothetical protein [bacterium]